MTKTDSTRHVTIMTYSALIIGLICLFITLRAGITGYFYNEYVLLMLILFGTTLSIYSLMKSTKKVIPTLSLLFSLSLPLSFIFIVIFFDFAP
ncbi:hypothetical protein [Bacillus sp. Marseille-P3800]|uniref:hypothetical protein n=1 Tax=Bacillus sp. Marseille-P3800 TaxID=2014782 RepID=UPI000C06E6E7|nr:hypothetical protein [Bacillus sp. Marseille-P3800]